MMVGTSWTFILKKLSGSILNGFPYVLSEYIKILTEGLQLLATVKKNTNVLLHIAGYFKKRLSPEDKRELLEVIEEYHKGYIPLIVPAVLINHYVRKFDEPYLKTQFYLNPHPM